VDVVGQEEDSRGAFGVVEGSFFCAVLIGESLGGGLDFSGDGDDVSLANAQRVQFEIARGLHDEETVVIVGSDPEVTVLIGVLHGDVFESHGLADPGAGLLGVVDDSGIDELLRRLIGGIRVLVGVVHLLLVGGGLLVRRLLARGRGALGEEGSGAEQQRGNYGQNRFCARHGDTPWMFSLFWRL
jgi:hypothetical protein